MKICMKFIAVGLAGIGMLSNAYAESFKVELGWGNITPCSRLEANQVYNATMRYAEQRVYAYAVVEAPSVGSIQNDIQQCAVQGAAAAGLTAIIASPAGAMPAFQSQFNSCIQSRAQSYFSLQLQVSEGQCMW